MSLSILFSVSVIKYFYRVRGLAARTSPNLEDQWLPFSLASTLWPARQGRTYWGVYDGKALKVTEARKLPHHDKAVVYRVVYITIIIIIIIIIIISRINLLVFYHKCCSLIGYTTHYLLCDR